MITPTVGRVVWVEPQKIADGRHNPALPLAALVVDVIDDRHVSVAAFSQHGRIQPFVNIALLQDNDPVPQRELTEEDHSALAENPKAVIDRSVTYARWMPFQLGQAKAQASTPAAAPARAPAKR